MVDRLLLDQLGYLNVPGASGDKADTPDHADFAITGDIDVRVLASATDWTSGSAAAFISQYVNLDRAWAFQVQGTGTLQFVWTTDGATQVSAVSSVAPTVADGAFIWLRLTLDVDNGAAGRDAKFYTSADSALTDPALVTWTQLGTTVTGAVTSIFNSTQAPTLGSSPDNFARLNGTIYCAEVRNGIGGTVIANPDFRDAGQQTSATTLTDDFGKVWTVRGAASWTLPGATDSYQLEDGSGVILLESSVPDVFIPYRNQMPPLIAQ